MVQCRKDARQVFKKSFGHLVQIARTSLYHSKQHIQKILVDDIQSDSSQENIKRFLNAGMLSNDAADFSGVFGDELKV